jgi:hypothetical protein
MVSCKRIIVLAFKTLEATSSLVLFQMLGFQVLEKGFE